MTIDYDAIKAKVLTYLEDVSEWDKIEQIQGLPASIVEIRKLLKNFNPNNVQGISEEDRIPRNNSIDETEWITIDMLRDLNPEKRILEFQRIQQALFPAILELAKDEPFIADNPSLLRAEQTDLKYSQFRSKFIKSDHFRDFFP